MSEPAGKAVFLSYASQDAEAARRVCEALRAAGIEVWFDQNELVGGDAWDQKIRRQIKECALFVPVISASTNARAEGYFRLEWLLAVERSRLMADDAPFIVPVVIDDTVEAKARVPDRFRERQWTCIKGADAPGEFARRVRRLLDGEPEAGPVASAIPPQAQPRRGWTRVIGVAVPLAALAAVAIWFLQRDSRKDRARDFALPEARRLAENHDFAAAFALAGEAERHLPGDPALKALWPKIAIETTIETTPSGADIYLKEYGKPAAEWQHLGKSPLKEVRLARAAYRWQFRKAGFASVERAGQAPDRLQVALDPDSSSPPGMVHVDGGQTTLNLSGLEHLAPINLPDYFIDRFEVTNRQFKEFIDQGGYGTAAFWKQPFAEQGKEISRVDALARFRDATGQPGPANWKNGTFPEGQGDYPVTGVSWFEAAAYAESVHKRLPSIYHWSRAASAGLAPLLVPLSNFSSRDLAPVGKFTGMSAYGAYDMAGNAKEWCWNEAGAEKRYILGGGWREPDYLFTGLDAQSPFDRSTANGFRCVKVEPSLVPAEVVDARVAPTQRDYTKEQPVSDEVFKIYQSLFSYDKTALEVRVESTADNDERWHQAKVTFNAAYGNERMEAVVFSPKNFPPPYQTVIYFPGSGAINQRSTNRLERQDLLALLIGSGRAVVFPVYKGTYSRGDGLTSSYPEPTSFYRDHVIYWSKDLGRTIDYLETRKDIQAEKLAFLGVSWGGRLGCILPALENRIKVVVLGSGGFRPQATLPQVDQINFAPRVKVPVLMVNGRYDFLFPVESGQLPMFRLLGAPPEHKRHVILEVGHGVPSHLLAKEAIDWLDRYLGTVK